MKILVFIPTLNAEKFLEKQIQLLKEQTIIPDIYVVDSGSTDNTLNILMKYSINFEQIKKGEFNHGLTRNKIIKYKDYDFYLFLTQDAIPCDEYLVENMIKGFDKDVKIVYARQIPYSFSNEIEKISRRFNYPDYDILKDKTKIQKLGIKTFFTSNSCCMYDAKYFISQKGFIKTNISEDMEFAYRTIMDDKKIKYISSAHVCHSHKYSLKDLHKRYYKIGYFLKRHHYLKKYPATGEGKEQAKFILLNLIKNNIFLIPRFVAEMVVKYMAFKVGNMKMGNVDKKI